MKFKLGDKVIIKKYWIKAPCNELVIDGILRGTIIQKKPHDGYEEEYYRVRYETPQILKGLGNISSSLYHSDKLQLDVCRIRNEKINQIV